MVLLQPKNNQRISIAVYTIVIIACPFLQTPGRPRSNPSCPGRLRVRETLVLRPKNNQLNAVALCQLG